MKIERCGQRGDGRGLTIACEEWYITPERRALASPCLPGVPPRMQHPRAAPDEDRVAFPHRCPINRGRQWNCPPVAALFQPANPTLAAIGRAPEVDVARIVGRRLP